MSQSPILQHLVYGLNQLSNLAGLRHTGTPPSDKLTANKKSALTDQAIVPSEVEIECANDMESFDAYIVAMLRYWKHRGIPIDNNADDPTTVVVQIYRSVRYANNKQSNEWTNTMIEFASQCVSGSLLQIYKSLESNLGDSQEITPKLFRDTAGAFCDMVLVAYMNTCWHDFHQENDPYIVEVFSTLCHGGVKEIDITCCFDYVLQIVRRLCEISIDGSAYHCRFEGGLEKVQASVKLMVLCLSEDIRDSVGEIGRHAVCCAEHAVYDGSDLFVFDDENEDDDS